MNKIIPIIIILHLIMANEPIAVVSKIRGKVQHKMLDDNKYKSNIRVNSPIFLESQIRTEDKAFVKVVFLDDGTSISMYSGSEIIIKGEIDKRMISKQIELITGIITVNVTNQALGEFKLVTPNSELTCLECGFWLLSNPLTGDKFIKESGDISIWNPSMNRTVVLVPDTTIISLINKEFQKYETPVTDIKYLESLMLEVDERTLQYKKEGEDDSLTEKVTNVLVIKLKNAANVEREIILTYTQ
ncbi:MAG: FecR domain-containing protein [Candidatus Marinimicrobia bacterium]|nr:FecR domain-containing protein [Candidatus Neomarinimicrobiota bacterium]